MRVVEFDSLFQFIRNGMNVKQDKSGKGIPITRIETIANGTVDASRVGFADLSEADCRNWIMEPGDILFSHINSVEHVGKCAVYRGSPKKLVHGMNLLCLRCDETQLIPDFAKYLISGKDFRSRLSNFINKAVNQASVSIGNLKTIRVSVPCIPEQRRIAAILDQADALRAKRREALAQLDSLTQSIFIEMFGDLASNSKGWTINPLNNFIFAVTNGLTRRRSENNEGADIVLRLRDIRSGWIDFSDVNRITMEPIETKRYSVSPGDLLFIRVNGNPDYVGRCAIFEGYSEPVFFNDHIMRVKVDSTRIHSTFLAFLLNSKHGKNEIAKYRKTSAGQHTINQDGLGKIQVPTPPVTLQAEFVRHLESIGRQKNAFNESHLELDALFSSLQHRAFRGEL